MEGGRLPRVSVVIPCYNSAGFIQTALESVYQQTYRDFEVLVVNDGSPDTEDLERVLRPWAERIRYLHRQENQGPGGARNVGIRAAHGELVALLDSDDTWLPTHLAEQVARFERDPGLDLVYCDALLVGDTPHAGTTFMQGWPSHGEVSFQALLRLDCMVSTSCVVARRETLLRAGLFDERFFHSEDYDLWLRVAYHGGRFAYHTGALVRHVAHAASLAAESDRLIAGQMRVLQVLPQKLAIEPADQRIVDERIAWCQAHLDLSAAKRALALGDVHGAAESMTRATRVLHAPKLRLAALGLRFAPGLVRWLYRVRQARWAASGRGERLVAAAVAPARAELAGERGGPPAQAAPAVPQTLSVGAGDGEAGA